ncbi:MAG: sulfotransferase [Pseudomonadota bacterium]
MAQKQSVQALFEKGAKLARAGDLNGAAKQFRLIVKTNPNVAEAQFQLGQIAARQGNGVEATTRFAAAYKLRPSEPGVIAAYAGALHQAGKDAAALPLYDKLIALRPNDAKPRADKAFLLQRAGQFDAAEAEFRAALANDPYDGELYRVFLATKKLDADDPLIPSMKTAWGSVKLNDRARANLGYALAKVMEDTGQHDQVFKYLDPANALMANAFPFQMSERVAEVQTIRRLFDDWTPPKLEKTTNAQPIFITGMPRSGTTLVEQILASHSRVTGGGELAIALKLAYQTIGFEDGGVMPGPKAITDLGFAYEKELKRKIGPHGIATDKSIQTYMVMGLMKHAIPGAKFVIVKRDPRDVGLSIYKNYFAAGTHRYATDLRVIGEYIALYEQLIAFWKARIPDAIYEVAYEDLIANPEEETRKLVAACGLDWEDACLTFHETKRDVKTLSLHQVRQPIYASSTKAWMRYEKELAPLIEALEEGGCL